MVSGPAEAIVVGLDGSSNSALAAHWAIDEARWRGVRVETIYAWHLPAMAYEAEGFVEPSVDEIAQDFRPFTDKVLAEASGAGVPASFRVVDGRPADVLRQEASADDVLLLVVGGRGLGGVAGLLLGSVSNELAHRPVKPVVIVPSHREEHAAKQPLSPATTGEGLIVVGVDGSANSRIALRWAAQEARLRGVGLRAVIAWSVSPAEYPAHFPLSQAVLAGAECAATQILDGAVDELDPGMEIDRVVVKGHPAPVLLKAAQSADLLVVGTRGRGAAAEALLGSTSRTCAHRSPVPVVIVPDHD